MMSMLKKVVLFPISLFVAFLALMAKWLLTLSSYVVAPLMLYIFGCGIYTACRQTWDQFLILLVSEFICFILFFGATAITEVKRGKYTSVKGARQKRFIRFKTLGAGYSEDELKAVIAGKAEHHPHQKQPPQEQPFQLLVNIQAKLSEGKSEGYARWAKKYNLKEMSKTLIFLQEHKIGSTDELNERAAAATEKYHQLGDSIKAAETRMAEIAVLKTHIVNYAKTHPVYDAYRKAGYSKKFLDTHREEITLHKVAKAAFDETGLKKLPKVKALNAEYSDLLTQKKAAYPDYRKAREEMQELVKAQKNIELFFTEEKDAQEKQQTR